MPDVLDSVRRPGAVPAVVAVVLVAGLVTADVVAGPSVVLIGLTVSAPLLCGVASTPAAARAVGLLVVCGALLAFLWNDNLDSWSYWVPLTVVSMASVFGWLMATYRLRLARDALRMKVLADVAEVSEGRAGVHATAQSIADALVPAIADLCLIDLVIEGSVVRAAGTFDGASELLSALMARAPSPPEAVGSAAGVVFARTTRLVAIDDGVRRALAHDEEDFRLLQRLATTSTVSVPLVAREKSVGVLTLATRDPRPALDDEFAEYAETLAGRVALAVDNAALASDLASTEQQLQSILASADAGIMVRGADGRLVYANQAAADLLKLPDPAAVKAATSHELMELFDVYTEEGDPVSLTDLPGSRVLRGDLRPDPMTVRNIVRATGEERWLLNKATPVLDADGRPLLAVNLIEDVTQTKRAELAQRLLAEAGRQVTQADDLPAKLQAVADAAVPRFADWASVDLLDDDRRVRTVAIAHRDPDKVRMGWLLRTTWPTDMDAEIGLPVVLRTGEPQVMSDIDDALLKAFARDEQHLEVLRSVGLNATLIVPLVAGEEVLGALSFVSSTARRFDERDVQLALDLGRQTGSALRAAQLSDEREVIAHTLQAGLLPRRLPAIEGWSISSVYRPAGRLNEAGGDFYDVVPCGERWAAIIGDVVGKGAEAAAITAMVRHTVAGVLAVSDDPAVALGVLNRRLREWSEELPLLCTIAVLVLGSDDEVVVYAAGHPLPLLHRDGAVHEVGVTSPMLGVDDGVVIQPATLATQPGDHLLLYTDGVTDALGTGGRFGEERLLTTLSGLNAAEIEPPAAVVRSVEAFLAGDQTDDIAMVGLTRVGVTDRSAARPK